MKWSCDSEHAPTLVGESIYCSKCGVFLGNATNKDVVPIRQRRPDIFEFISRKQREFYVPATAPCGPQWFKESKVK